jgi:hypothetical protein
MPVTHASLSCARLPCGPHVCILNANASLAAIHAHVSDSHDQHGGPLAQGPGAAGHMRAANGNYAAAPNSTPSPRKTTVIDHHLLTIVIVIVEGVT